MPSGNHKVAELESTLEKASQIIKDLNEEIEAQQSQLIETITEKVSTDNIDMEALEAFGRKQYVILPKSPTEYWVVVPRFVPFHIGWLERQTESYNIFVINKFVDWITPLPHDIKSRLGLEPYLREGAQIIHPEGKSPMLQVSPEELDKAYGKYKKYLTRRVSEADDLIYIDKNKEWELLAQLIDDGMLPFEAKPIDEKNLAPDPGNIQLREYQERAWGHFKTYGAIGVYWPPGAGKTIIGLYVGNRVKGKKLIVVPQKTLKEQWQLRINTYATNPREWEVQTYHYVVKHLKRYQKKTYALGIFDECFPYHDCVYTEYGPIPIGYLVENHIRCKVWSYNFSKKQLELKPITFHYQKYANSVLEIKTKYSVIHPTKAHNIYSPDGNHLPAKELGLYDETICVRNMWPGLRDPLCIKRPQDASQASRSQQENKQENLTVWAALEQDKPRSMERVQGQPIGIKETGKQPQLEGGLSSANMGENRLRGLQFSQNMYDMRRQIGCNTIGYTPQKWGPERQFKREPHGLMPLLSRKPTPGRWSHYTTVDNVRSIRELALNDPRVYDLEVADNHNYFINGTLVSNCHHLPANTFSKLATLQFPYRIGLSASPYREDGRTEYIFALTGFPIGLKWRELISIGVVREPDIKVYLYNTRHSKRSAVIPLVRQQVGKVLVYCDGVVAGQALADELEVPYVYGQTNDRIPKLLDNRVVVASRVADEGVSIPGLNMVIEYDFHGGSRRQEAQRMGRLMHSVEERIEHIVMMTEEEYSKFEKRLYSIEEQGIAIRFERRG